MTRPRMMALVPLLSGAAACTGPTTTEPTDTGEPGSRNDAWMEVDTAACPATSATHDDCCWDGRQVLPGPALLDEVLDCSPTWTGAFPGITVIRTPEALEAWWNAVGTTGRSDVDFSTELAVAWIGETSAACDEHHFDGLRPGDTRGSWLAGVGGWTYCYAPEVCTEWTVRATLWTGPIGEVTECEHYGYCDG